MKKSQRKNISRKAFYFLLDSLLASMLLIGGLLALSSVVHKDSYTSDIDYMSKDVLNVLSVLTIGDMNSSNHNNSFVVSEIKNGTNNGTITNMDYSILEQVGEYWAKNKTDNASQLLYSVLSDADLPSNIQITAMDKYRNDSNTNILYSSNTSNISNDNGDIVASRMMISGIQKGAPLSGSTSTAYVRKIAGKKTSTYAYFGGFVGQGNITTLLELNGNITITDITLEMDVATGSSFMILINNGKCNDSSGNSLFNATTPSMIVDKWNITNCTSLLTSGTNNLSFLFSNISRAYIQGGYFKVTYITNQFQENSYNSTGIKYLPGINGVVNLFDSFYVPGELGILPIH